MTSSQSLSSCLVRALILSMRCCADIPALEPMLLAVTVYMSFVYGVVYLLFEAYPFVFVNNHGFNAGEEGLTFLFFFSGGLSCCILFVLPIPQIAEETNKFTASSPLSNPDSNVMLKRGPRNRLLPKKDSNYASYPAGQWSLPFSGSHGLRTQIFTGSVLLSRVHYSDSQCWACLSVCLTTSLMYIFTRPLLLWLEPVSFSQVFHDGMGS